VTGSRTTASAVAGKTSGSWHNQCCRGGLTLAILVEGNQPEQAAGRNMKDKFEVDQFRVAETPENAAGEDPGQGK